MRIMLLILAAGALAHKCSTTNKGVNHSLAQAIAHNLNSLRNRVATGQTSFEGSESASNMNLVHWSNGYAKRAQACAENCPAKSSTCREVPLKLSFSTSTLAFWCINDTSAVRRKRSK